MTRQPTRTFSYQDGLRAVGAWLDIRGYREIRIVEVGSELVVEAASGGSSPSAPAEVLRFDADHMKRLRQAAFNDRGAPRAYPAHQVTSSER